MFITYCLEDIAGVKRHELILKGEQTVSESELLKFNFAIKYLKKYRPIQYILGNADFYGLKFKVNEHTLIPRPETEELVDLIVKEAGESRHKSQDMRHEMQENNKPEVHNLQPATENSILDIGTGSGCIAIALKKNIPWANVYAMDISAEALKIAIENAQLNNVDIDFIKHDILSPSLVEQSFDIIVSNPPYVRESEKQQMKANVLKYEPHTALFVADEEPFVFYDAIADFALKYLKKGGKLYFEINEYLGDELVKLIEGKGFKNVGVLKDLNGKNRILRITK